MISAMLSNLLWASSIMALCFPCFTVCVAIIEREKNTLNPPKAVPTGMPTLLANAEIEVPPVIADNVIRLVAMIPMIVLNHFIFLAWRLRASISSSKYASISVNFF